jgi:23S rRNA (adenine2503-C2)-methyltransferase
MPELCGMTPDEIYDFIKTGKYTHSHAITIANGIYGKHVKDIHAIPGIPNKLKLFLLENNFRCCSNSYEKIAISSDKTIKYLFKTQDGKVFETVYIPDNKRNTVCVSTQSGCRMGCSYCTTGRYGFHGNLSAGEIINQLISLPDSMNITHVVFMGMGEPMDNLKEVLKACDILTSQWGLSIGKKNVTVSTVGIIPGILEFLERSDYNLTFSLYSPFKEEREKVVPAEKTYPAKDILEIMKNFPLKKKRRLSVSYIMINNENDSDDHLKEIIALLAGSRIRVNLIPYHSSINDTVISSSDSRLQYFKHTLITSGISASVRRSRGEDISAACGLLAATD